MRTLTPLAWAIALEGNPFDQGVADDAQIAAGAGRFEIGIVGGNPAAGFGVDGVRRGAGAGWRVMVFAPAIAQPDECLAQRPIDVAPVGDRRAIHRDWAVIAVIRGIGEVLVGFEFAEIGQHRVPFPAGAAGRRPAVEIIRHGANGDLAVDRRTAAHGVTAP